MRIGIDAGGTFTDFVVLHDDGRLESFKLPSNPRSPAQVILAGLRKAAGATKKRVEVVHGSTVATNALLEHKGVPTAFVTTAGFEDLLEIGRQNRAELYNLTPAPRRPLIDRGLCFGLEERMLFDGSVLRAPSAAGLKRLAAAIARSRVRSVAICLLHSYQNPAHERAVLKALANLNAYVSASHEISPEFREYERASTTAVNAYVGPLMQAYLEELGRARGFRISIMQSSGGFLSARQAGRHPARTVLSGPAGGVIGALSTARASGFPRLLGFDMGGTSTDVSLVDGEPRHTTESIIGGLPIRLPMLDIHTVGAGGGSVARVDAGGLLRVGPESAGAEPGPACYGKGSEATVTDAHVVLGRVDALLGGAMAIDLERAKISIEKLAGRLKLDVTAAAAGILRVANANMERAIRSISVERGYDPRDFALVAFGGCGGLHACEIAAELGIRTVLVPQYAGALSALGMLMADAVRDYSAGVLGRDHPDQRFAALEKRAARESPGALIEHSADLRYRGQSYEINVPCPGLLERAIPQFHREHLRLYGYSNPDREIEVVTLRVRARTVLAKPRLTAGRRAAGSAARRRVYAAGAWHDLDVWHRESLGSTTRRGPSLILDYGSTTLIPTGWEYRLDRSGNLIVTTAPHV